MAITTCDIQLVEEGGWGVVNGDPGYLVYLRDGTEEGEEIGTLEPRPNGRGWLLELYDGGPGRKQVVRDLQEARQVTVKAIRALVASPDR